VTDANKEFGKRGEELAAKELGRLGYKVLETNYRTPIGEIDIIAMDGGTLVFVEVKSRRDDSFGAPEISVHHHKRRQITRAALLYIGRRKKQGLPCRFDVVGICPGTDGRLTVKVIKDAFEVSGGY
jgi:putative endonuclease